MSRPRRAVAGEMGAAEMTAALKNDQSWSSMPGTRLIACTMVGTMNM